MNSRLAAGVLALAPLFAQAAVCRIVSGSGLAFGTYDTLASAPRDSQTTLMVRCSGSGSPEVVTLMVGVDPGLHGTPGGMRRMMHTAGTADALAYNLYRDAGRSSSWGMSTGVDTVPITITVPATGSTSAAINIYARIPARQEPRVGTYADAVMVTIDY